MQQAPHVKPDRMETPNPAPRPFPVAPAVLWKKKAQTSSLHINHQPTLSPRGPQTEWSFKEYLPC